MKQVATQCYQASILVFFFFLTFLDVSYHSEFILNFFFHPVLPRPIGLRPSCGWSKAPHNVTKYSSFLFVKTEFCGSSQKCFKWFQCVWPREVKTFLFVYFHSDTPWAVFNMDFGVLNLFWEFFKASALLFLVCTLVNTTGVRVWDLRLSCRCLLFCLCMNSIDPPPGDHAWNVCTHPGGSWGPGGRFLLWPSKKTLSFTLAILASLGEQHIAGGRAGDWVGAGAGAW